MAKSKSEWVESDPIPESPSTRIGNVTLTLDEIVLRGLVQEVVGQVMSSLDWPAGRLALTEEEAAAACGVGRHVLRDLRLQGRLVHRKLGKRVVYLREDLSDFLKTNNS